MRCNITLKPYGENRRISHMEVTFTFDSLQRKKGEELCRAQLSAHYVPGCDAENFTACDEKGEIEVETSITEPYPYRYRNFTLCRDTYGRTEVHYTVKPRPLLPTDRCAPYLDFRCEEGGATSAGSSFLADFGEIRGEIALSWDMTQMPEGNRGICAFGEGDFVMNGTLERLRQCYFAMGDVKSITQDEFGVYWLSPPSFDMAAIAEYTKELFAKMRVFFHDQESNYRIFARKDPYQHSGGSALERSYMFGWNETEPVSVEDKQLILAHEMVHNWPHLTDEPFGITSWYSEGAAEYYSVVLPLRLGLITAETALKEIQSMTDHYYTNPTRHMENLEAARICWEDRRAQTLPYGRGVIFLANTDVKIRSATDGKKSIDDVVCSLLEKGRGEQPLGNETFLETVKVIAGIDVTKDWEIMRTGVHFAPLSGGFDPRFTVTEKEMPEAGTGKTVVSYQWNMGKCEKGESVKMDAATIKINRDRLMNQFVEMTRFDSESFHEREIADYLTAELKKLGIEVREDDAGVRLQKLVPQYPAVPTGNLYGFLKGTAPGEPLLLSAHMDTVSPGFGKKATVDENGRITSDGTTVLGADDLSGVVAILEAVRQLQENGIPYPDLEFLFPVAEERHGHGSSLIDYSMIRSRKAYTFDLSGEIGVAATAAPTILYYEIEVEGRSAHAGFCPQLGIHAIKIAARAIAGLRQGWLDEQTTLNIGKIESGKQSNIVPEHCLVVGEIRSLDDARAMEEWENVKAVFEKEAAAEGGHVTFHMEKKIKAYKVEDEEPVVQRFKRVCAKLGLSGETQVTLGGSDNNHYVNNGIRGIVAACGMNEVHTTAEYTTVDQLETCTRLVLGLILEQDA